MTLHTALEVKVPLFGNSPFIAVKVGGEHDNPARGLMLISPPADPADDVQWLVGALTHSLSRFEAHEGPLDLEDESRMRREHALLFSIINAATDPMLLTNMEGQLIIANARAEMLFTAPDDVSEGRRRAVQLNNMFFSAAL